MPQAFQSGCAARAWATAARTSVGQRRRVRPELRPSPGLRRQCGTRHIRRRGHLRRSVRGTARARQRAASVLHFDQIQPPGGAVGPAADRARASRMPRKSSRLTVPFRSAEMCQPGSAPCDEEIRCRAPYRSILRLRAPSWRRRSSGRCWCEGFRVRHSFHPLGSTAANDVKSCLPTTTPAAATIADSSSG